MTVQAHTGRRRAQRLYPGPLGQCEECGEKPAVDRHHRDRDTLNNARTNVAFVCRSCHSRLDGQGERLRLSSRLKTQATHCIRGHEFTTENTYHRPDRPQNRMCRKCRAAAVARTRARKAEHVQGMRPAMRASA